MQLRFPARPERQLSERDGRRPAVGDSSRVNGQVTSVSGQAVSGFVGTLNVRLLKFYRLHETSQSDLRR